MRREREREKKHTQTTNRIESEHMIIIYYETNYYFRLIEHPISDSSEWHLATHFNNNNVCKITVNGAMYPSNDRATGRRERLRQSPDTFKSKYHNIRS